MGNMHNRTSLGIMSKGAEQYINMLSRGYSQQYTHHHCQCQDRKPHCYTFLKGGIIIYGRVGPKIMEMLI